MEGSSAGTSVGTPVSGFDILPTAIAATGAAIPDAWQLDGVNLLPHILNPRRRRSRTRLSSGAWKPMASAIPRGGVLDGLRAMRSGNWKLVKPAADATWELYDLSSDESETTNLADTNPAVLQSLIVQYEAWSAGLARPRWAVDDLDYATPDFIPEDVRIGAAATSYLSPDFLPDATQVAYQSSGGVLSWANLDPVRGFPTSLPGALDVGLAPLTVGAPGPQWSRSAQGPALFYTKPGSFGRKQIWRALIGGPVEITASAGFDSFGARVSQDPGDPAVKLLFNAGTTAAWGRVAPPGTATVVPDHAGDPENGAASGSPARMILFTSGARRVIRLCA